MGVTWYMKGVTYKLITSFMNNSHHCSIVLTNNEQWVTPTIVLWSNSYHCVIHYAYNEIICITM